MYKILCVEDEADVQAVIKATLRAHRLVFAKTVKEAEMLINRDRFSLVIIDIGLPDGSGLELLATLGERLSSTPVIFLTGKTDFASKASAFSLGAEDFIIKPFDPRELKIRVDAKLKRNSESQDIDANIE
jgi:two-component system response regulator TctD